jgi:hypothetical protein
VQFLGLGIFGMAIALIWYSLQVYSGKLTADPFCLQTAWHCFIGVSNIATDLLLVTQSMLLISRVQTSFKKRLGFAGIFLPRAL